MRRRWAWALGGLAAAGIVAQLVPVERSNPPVETEVPVAVEVRSLLERACYDCHSNETVWPSYSRIAPVSWLVTRDVAEGRDEVNYSTWNRLSREERAEMVHESWEHVEEGDMPPRPYLLMHPEARLSAADRALLRSWAAARGEPGD